MSPKKQRARRAEAKRPRPGRRWLRWAAGIAVVGLVVTVAVVVSGFDSRETPREDPSVWVVRATGQYARVNTETAEIDTVRQVEGPSGVVQSGGFGLLLTQGDGRAWAIDPTAPQDIRDDAAAEQGASAEDDQTAAGEDPEDAEAASAEAEQTAVDPSDDDSAGASAIRTPGGTRQVIAAGDAVLFYTESGEAHVGRIEASTAGRTLGSLTRLDPFAEENSEAESEEERKEYHADAAAIDANGLVALFSQAEHAIRWYEIATGEFRRGTSEVPEDVPSDGVQLAIAGGEWVLLDETGGRLWREGEGPVELELTGAALLQGSSTGSSGGPVLVADQAGLWSVDAEADRASEADGIPARPEQVGGEMVAAWIGTASAALWTEAEGDVALELDASVEDSADPTPVIRTSGGRALLTDMRSGMMWTVPDGRLIPVEQWSLVNPPKQEAGTVVTQDVKEQEPPVAVADSFGVRAGEPALLPVLLNDYDPNRKDVLTVVTAGLGEGLSADFGTVEALSDGQGIMVHPSVSASGSASFSYSITDGVNVSPPATVTLTAVPEEVNTAPQWCAVEGCQRTWPAPELAPGGTLVLPIIEGWVDPQGDPMTLAEATPANSADPVRALVTADGRLAVRHTDPNAPDGDIVVNVRVMDSRGETTDRELRVRVRPGAAAEFAPIATTIKTGEPTLMRPLDRVTGGSGSFALVDAAVQSGNAGVLVNQGTGTVELSAETPGVSLVSVTVRDTVTDLEISGVARVTAVEQRAALAVPPLRAFVRPLSDTTIDVLDAIPGANSRSLVVQSVEVIDGELRADVIEHARIRLSGSTTDGQPGRIGSAEAVIAEGDLTARGRITVFQVPETLSSGAIAVADAVTVRAGSVVNIPVLDNDVAPPGERLVLHPEVGAPGVEGELAFASGSQVRYLAPSTPGTYTLSYTTYGASSPEMSDVGQVRVTVQPTGSNRDPQPPNVTVRLAPGESVTAQIPVTRADPDGDRVRLVTVGTPEDSQVSASVLPRSGTVQVSASTAATRGTRYVSYTVRDDFGGEADGRLHIIVSEPDPAGGAPIVYSDYVRVARGTAEPVVVRPLDNDLDPSGGALTITEVVPNVPGGEESPLYAELAQRLDLASLQQGVVRITSGEELGTFSFRYTVRSNKTKSTADGLIVVQVSDRIGRQAPSVQDTVLSVRDRAELQTSGVDVMTGRVRWATGDTDKLQLTLWGSAADRYRVSGSSIVGDYRAEGDVVPFKLAGTDFSGEEVETFGFLVVPPLDELRLTLKPGAGALSVNENRTVDADLEDLLDLGPGDAIELADGPFSVQRGQASCVPIGQTGIRYSAGKEAPWSDTCTVRVRLVEQNTYTSIPIAVDIKPDEPVVMLNPLTRTISPGATETIDLTDMVAWQGGREGRIGDLRWQATGGSSPFEVAASGAQVQVTVRADGVPGSQQVVSVGVSGSGESQSTLTLRVGTAAQDTPRGGTVSLQCTVGSSCSAPLLGVAGEHDPFAGKSGGGLQLVSVDSGGCQFGNLQASGSNVTVSWSDNRGPGGRCTASYTVRDAQNRTGTGTIEFDAQGVPRAPLSIEATGANASSVTLTVSLNSQNAHPEVTGVEILNEGGGTAASCSPSGNLAVCTVDNVPVGKENGRRYLARAVNSVGPSDPTLNASAATWAYVAPPAPNVTAEAVKDPTNTSQEAGQAKVSITGSDRARRFLLSIDDGERFEVGRNSTHSLAPGTHRFTVIPEDRDLPPGYAGTAEGAAGTAQVVVKAAPILTGVALEVIDETSAQVVYAVDNNYAESVDLRYGISGPNGTSASCTSNSSTFDSLIRYRTYVAAVCATSDFGTTKVTTDAVWVGGVPDALTVNSGYRIGGGSAGNEYVREYTTVTTQPTTSSPVSGAWRRYLLSTGGVSDSVLGTVPVGATVEVQQCISGPASEYCSTPVAVPAAGSVSTRVTWNGVCVDAAGDLSSVFVIEGRPFGEASFAQQGQNIRVSWSPNDFQNSVFNGAICPAPPEPEPEPDPGP